MNLLHYSNVQVNDFAEVNLKSVFFGEKCLTDLQWQFFIEIILPLEPETSELSNPSDQCAPIHTPALPKHHNTFVLQYNLVQSRTTSVINTSTKELKFFAPTLLYSRTSWGQAWSWVILEEYWKSMTRPLTIFAMMINLTKWVQIGWASVDQ